MSNGEKQLFEPVPVDQRMQELLNLIRDNNESWILTPKTDQLVFNSLAIDDILNKLRELYDLEKECLAYTDLCEYVIQNILKEQNGRLLELIRTDPDKWKEYGRNDFNRQTFVNSENEDLLNFRAYKHTLKIGIEQIQSAIKLYNRILSVKVVEQFGSV